MSPASRPLALLAASLPLAAGCGVSGAVDMRWGDDAANVAARHGAPCSAWSAWGPTSGVESCENDERLVRAYRRDAYLRLYRRGDRLEGLALRFPHARWATLRGAVLADLPLWGGTSGPDLPYEVFFDDSLVRVEEDEREGSTTLTVMGPAIGKAYVGYVLGQGLGGLFRGH